MHAVSPHPGREGRRGRDREHDQHSPRTVLAFHRTRDEECSRHVQQRVWPSRGRDERRGQKAPPLARGDVDEPNAEAIYDVEWR